MLKRHPPLWGWVCTWGFEARRFGLGLEISDAGAGVPLLG